MKHNATMRHLKFSNCRTGFEYVCSQYCPLCTLHDKLRALTTLAHNLAIAGSLQRALQLGYRRGYARAARSADEVEMWWPGCGRSAP